MKSLKVGDEQIYLLEGTPVAVSENGVKPVLVKLPEEATNYMNNEPEFNTDRRAKRILEGMKLTTTEDGRIVMQLAEEYDSLIIQEFKEGKWIIPDLFVMANDHDLEE